ncbi:MAG TPA: hypothetical protein VHG35_01800 [Gemmatimonadales bacterium]|nr:hypothetical protein [Gemmatimonadales bacterium]
MTHRPSVIRAGWRALGLLSLAAAGAGCSHSEPFSNPQGSEEPFDPGPPARLTLNPGHDGHPSWLPDGSGILYSSQQLDRTDADVCLTELPETGGRQRWLACDLAGDRTSRDAGQSAAVSPDGRLAVLRAGNGESGGQSPVFLDIALAPSLDVHQAQTVRTLPFAPAGGASHDYAGHLRWLREDALVYVGQLFRAQPACPDRGCPLDTLLLGTEVTLLELSGSAVNGSALPGTTQATGVAPILDGTAILYTLRADTRIYRRDLSSGQVAVVHDFGAAGVARDVHAAGDRMAAVVGGRLGFAVDPRIGPAEWDSGGIVHVLELDGANPVVLDTPGRLYRRPALSPDGSRLVAEGFPLIINVNPVTGEIDTTVNRSGDLYLFGAE